MPKAKGCGSLWTKIKKIKDFKESYIQEIASHIEESLEIKNRQLNSESENLRIGAANFYLAEWAKLEKEFRNTQPEDTIEESPYERHKKKLEKEKAAGVTRILKLTCDEEDEDTGTDG